MTSTGPRSRLPVTTIGFNDFLGWTHTVKTLDPCDLYGSRPGGGYPSTAFLPFESRTETLRVAGEGTPREEALTLRRSSTDQSWRRRATAAIRIASVGRRPSAAHLVEQWWDMGRASNLNEFGPRCSAPAADVQRPLRRPRQACEGLVRRPGASPAVGLPAWTKAVPGGYGCHPVDGVHPFDDLPR